MSSLSCVLSSFSPQQTSQYERKPGEAGPGGAFRTPWDVQEHNSDRHPEQNQNGDSEYDPIDEFH
jgi:hypothetical protein